MSDDGTLPEVRHLVELARLRAEPGDVFVLTIPGTISADAAARLKAQWESLMGSNCKLLVFDRGAKLGVINAGTCCGECHYDNETRTPVSGGN